MALSDELSKLAGRAKEAETRTAAARDEARAELERNVSSARASAQEQADKLRQTAERGEARVSSLGQDMQRSWNEHIARAREGIESKKAELDVHKAQRRADDAEGYASFAIDLAYSAVVEAEYAALDAVLARMDADQLSAQPGAAS